MIKTVIGDKKLNIDLSFPSQISDNHKQAAHLQKDFLTHQALENLKTLPLKTLPLKTLILKDSFAMFTYQSRPFSGHVLKNTHLKKRERNRTLLILRVPHLQIET